MRIRLTFHETALDEERASLVNLCSHVLSKVLIPTDLSKPSKAAISFVARLKGIENIDLLHIVPKEGTKEEMDAKVKAFTDELNLLAEELAGIEAMKVTPPLGVRLSEAALRCRICSKGLNIDCHVVPGDAVKEVNEIADRENASLIAMSFVGESSSDGGHAGRTAYDIASTATRPVLVIRTDQVSMLRKFQF